MDPRKNPYAPGAGSPPPELAGRDELIDRAVIALDRIRNGLFSKSFIFHGLRGVGKTVLLHRVRQEAEARRFACVWMEAPEERSLPALLIPALKGALTRLSRGAALRAGLERAMGALAAFTKAFRMKYEDIEVTFQGKPKSGTADSGDLETDLGELLRVLGEAAAEHKTAIVLFIDELQYVREDELAALITALHRSAQEKAPVTMLGAGLPQIIGQMGRAKSYAERLFEFVPIDSLSDKAARDALCVPARKEGVILEEGAIAVILRETRGYPYFLQEWGKHCWDIAERSPIGSRDAQRATALALDELDRSFFRVRFDRLTPSERRYMRAMAELGPGPHRSGDIAEKLKRKVTAVAPIRNKMIAKGMLYSPAHGDTGFTVPLFDGFMKRIMPEF